MVCLLLLIKRGRYNSASETNSTWGIHILNGYGANSTLYEANNRVKDYRLIITAKSGRQKIFTGTFSDGQCTHEHPASPIMSKNCFFEYNLGGESIKFEKPLCIKKITLEVLSVYKGNKYNDTCLADIAPIVCSLKDETDRGKIKMEREACR